MTTAPIHAINHLAGQSLADPYPFYARARREAPVFHSPIFNLWIVSRHDDVTAVLKDPTRFSSAEALSPPRDLPPEIRAILGEHGLGTYPLLASDPPAHTRIRNLVAKAFSAQRIAAMEPQIRATATALIDDFAQEGQADLIRRFAYPLPMRVIAGMFGIKDADMDAIKRWCDDETLFLSGHLPLEQAITCAHSVAAYRTYLRALVEDRRRAPGDDLVSDLIAARLEGETPLSTEELMGLLCVLIFAGHETTTNMLGNTLFHLLRRKDLFRALCDDPRLIPNALEEALRFDAPVQGMMRTVTEQTRIGDVELPKGARLLVLFASANRDESAIDDAERLDIHRPTPLPHLSFGRGVHFCIGAALARLEGRVALELLTRRLPDAHLVTDEPPDYSPNLFHRGPKSLHVAWNP